VGSAFETEVHREMVENLVDLQSCQAVEIGNQAVLRRVGARRIMMRLSCETIPLQSVIASVIL
jgi:hypothetical protein